MQRGSVQQDRVQRENVQQDGGQGSLPVCTMMTKGNAAEPRAIDDDHTPVTLGPNDVVQHKEPARDSTTVFRVTGDDLRSVIHDSAGFVPQTVDSSMDDEQLQGLGGSDTGNVKNHESCISGTGLGVALAGAVCTDVSPGAWSFRHRFDEPSKR